MLKIISRIYFFFIGWGIEGKKPQIKKYVMVAVPHTSNVDFPICMAALSMFGVDIRYLAKKELFKFPLGVIMRFFGGIAVDRSHKTNMVQSMIDEFNNHDELALLVPAEGTRGYVKEWKSGFYYTAVGAGVPIALGYLDYGRKKAGIFEELFYPSGNFEEDLPKLKLRFKGIQGKYPEMSSLRDEFK